MASNRTRRRGQLRVSTAPGMAAAAEPSAERVTSWPVSASPTPRLRPIWGKSPAGKVSVKKAMKPSGANASRPETGSPATRQ